MTKKLRIHFIIFSMLALFIMQGLIIFFSAYRSYGNVVDKADEMIATIKSQYPNNSNIDARYFVVTIDRVSNAKNIDLNHISSIKHDKAQEYLKSVLNSNSDNGFIDTFRYQVFRDSKGITVIFLSRSYSFDALKNSILSSIIFSSIGMCVMLVLLYIASYWVTRPVSVAYKKQQQFITSASHELGTPLTVIKADTDIMLSEDPQNEWLQDINKQTLRLTTMTHNLITLAKLEEQGEHTKPIEFPISDLAEDVVKSYRAIAERENKNFKVSIFPNMSYNGDENLIRQLFTILLDNAFKYCSADGIITFNLAKTTQGISATVKNSTEQLDDKYINRIFDRFYRSENATSSNKKGFGLGLSIADSIVKNHRGKISAKFPDENVIEITAILR